MKNQKLIWVIIIAAGGAIIGWGFDDFLIGEGSFTGIIRLVTGGLFVLAGGWVTLKS